MPQNVNQIYNNLVLEFVSNATMFCNLMEQADTFPIWKLIDRLHKLLPQLYTQAAHLPEHDIPNEEQNQPIVSEDDYEYIHQKLLIKLGEYDAYEEVFKPDRIETENAVGASISEELSDIYQDIKNFVLQYEIGPEAVMHEAVWEVRQSFELYWGQKLVNTLRAIHNLRFSSEEIEESEYKPKENANFKKQGINNWIITRRQEEYRDDT